MLFGKTSNAETIFRAFNSCFLVIIAFLMIYPFWELLIVSISPAVEASKTGLKLIPRGFTLEAYRTVFESKTIGYGYFNSIFRTVVGTSITVFLCFCTAYPLAKKMLPARNAFTIYYLIPMFFGGGLIPNFLLIKSLGLLDTIWALIIPSLLSTFQILIMRNFIMSIPESLEESALVDGASFFMILLRIIIPLSMPIFATIALWEAVGHWNAWFDAMIYTRSNHNVVLQLLLRRVLIEHNNEGITDSLQGDEGIITKTMEAATVLVTIGPVVLMYPFLQKYFIKGVLVGSLKG
ncbi:carbohydrate ABC transporter permease [Paenibacillus sp. UNC451MF]|uniref:carbohydrate ABC transporter permease n=1 Tax=Paenibacillus sp. UNC451MF TaxID=1449063 RepID=UPI00048C861A|nr:carbohydrate ABC transporter permease [Paenibacillus sp. UNC451MF]